MLIKVLPQIETLVLTHSVAQVITYRNAYLFHKAFRAPSHDDLSTPSHRLGQVLVFYYCLSSRDFSHQKNVEYSPLPDRFVQDLHLNAVQWSPSLSHPLLDPIHH